jgi:hypothetical protein
VKTLAGLRPAAIAAGVACGMAACSATPGSLSAPAAPGSAKQPAAAPATRTGAARLCGGAARDTPGGPDPWGGCWPGPANTGVPAGTRLVNVDSAGLDAANSRLRADNTGWAFSPADRAIRVTAKAAVIDAIADTDGIYVPPGDSLTVIDSKTGYINDEGTSLVVRNSTLSGGGQWTFPTVGGAGHVTVDGSNLSGGEHEVLCGDDCTVRDSWLHDNANGAAAGAHQNGFLADGGTGFAVWHNSVYCTGGCTADISFLGVDDNATVTRNLLVASPDSSFCVYPGPNSAAQSGVDNVVWEGNVFQEGANGKCATYGPVYGWYPADGTGNAWSGNSWANGAPVTASREA